MRRQHLAVGLQNHLAGFVLDRLQGIPVLDRVLVRPELKRTAHRRYVGAEQRLAECSDIFRPGFASLKAGGDQQGCVVALPMNVWQTCVGGGWWLKIVIPSVRTTDRVL